MATDETSDGRHARRERNRSAVIEAAFSLIQEGKIPPSVDDVAERAGVSVSSIFRNFDGLADVQRQALDTFQPRFAHLFVVDDAERSRSDRVQAHVRSRVQLSTVAGGLMLVARSRALEHQPMVEGLARLRERLAEQTRQRFAVELGPLTSVDRANLASLIDSLTSPEAFELMSAAHARSPRQISKIWNTSLDVLLAQWAPGSPSPVATKTALTKGTKGTTA